MATPAHEPALDAASFDAFLLGMRVVLHAYELDPPATEFERPWKLLREIAEARATLTNPADTAARFPGLGEFLVERAADVHAHDRVTAQRILRGLGSAFESDG
jgi:hypothetical protein